MLSVLVWWLVIQAFGLAALPLAVRVFAWLPDRGVTFSKITGLLLVSYLLWLGASAGLLVNDGGGLALALLALAGASLAAIRGGEVLPHLRRLWREQRGHVLAAEVIFLLAFAGWALVRAYAPDKILPAGGEKYMEIAFLNGVLNSPNFPPLDPWMAGYGISYYYFGYVMMGVMARATGSLPGVAFDLYDALLFALSILGAYGVVSNMVRAAGGSGRAAAGYGLLGGVFTAMMGNLEGLLEGLYSSRALPEAFWQWIDIPDLAGTMQNGRFFLDSGWWWWRASRVLHERDLFGQPTVFQPIDEFPFFSFLLGDNHPHKLALPFVLLAVGLALNVLLRAAGRSPRLPLDAGDAGLALFAAVALGGLAFLNTWDFPIALGLVVLAWAAGRWAAGRQASQGLTIYERIAGVEPEAVRAESIAGLLKRALALGAALGIAAVALYIFFYLSFSSQAGGVLPHIFQPTRLPQWLVMWGPFAVVLAVFAARAALAAWPGEQGADGFAGRAGRALKAWLAVAAVSLGSYTLALLLAAAVATFTPLGQNETLRRWLGGAQPFASLGQILAARLADPWLFLALSALVALVIAGALRRLNSGAAGARAGELPAVFALLLAFTGLALTLAVEFFYLRDNFGVRMNTIFKFYFHAWILLACASAFAIWWLRAHLQGVGRLAFTAAAAALVAGGLVYPAMGVASRANRFEGPPNMDASASFSGFYPGHWAAQPDDWAAVQWLREHGRGADGSVPTILEAGAGGYENAGRISAFTGFPTVLGWTNHEGQWRGSQAEINRRAPDIVTIYTTPYAEVALELLRKWDVRYVIVGATEQQYIQRKCQEAASPCDPNRARGKFNQALVRVFESGDTIVYEVPAVP